MIRQQTNRTFYLRPALLSCLATLLLSACNGGSSSSDNTAQTPEPAGEQASSYTIDASDTESYVYYQLDDLSTPLALTDQQASISTQWDIALRRTHIMLNGGDSGMSTIAGALAVEQASFYDEQGNPEANMFLNASAENEGEVAFNTPIDTQTLTFESDSNEAAITGYGGWYNYNMTTHQVSANSDAYWLIRNQSGDSYAKINVTNIESLGRALNTLTVTFDLQSSTDSGFSGSVIEKTFGNIASAAVCYDIDQDAIVDCTESTAWDLQFDPNFTIWLNSDVYGSGSGAIAYGQLDKATADSISDGNSVTHWIKDSTSGVFADHLWYAYNLTGAHKLWPNYRVYLLQKGGLYYKFQIRSYYSEAGTSGHYLIKSEQL